MRSRHILVLISVLLAACGQAAPLRPEPAMLPEGGYVALAHYGTNPVIDTEEQSVVRLGLAADRASWALVHHYLAAGALPPPEAVRVEDCITALAPAPSATGSDAFTLTASIADSPFRPGWRTIVIAIAARPNGIDDLTVVSETPAAALELALARHGARLVEGGVAALPGVLERAGRVLLIGDGAGLGGPAAQAPLLREVAAFHAAGGTLSVVARLGPGMDDALLDRLAMAGGGSHDVLVRGEEAALARALVRAPGLTDAIAEVRLDRAALSRWRLVGHESRVARTSPTPSGGLIAGGDGVSLLLEVKPNNNPPSNGFLGTVRVWSDQGERSLPLAAGDGDPASHHAVVVIAAFAEKLRGSYWGKDVSWEALVREAAMLQSPALRSELGGLITRARALWVASPDGPAGPAGIESPWSARRELP